MKKFRLICFCLALGALNGCVTPRQSEQPQVLDKLRAMGVDQKTYAKIASHRVLSYDDIYELVKKRVPGPVIVTYLRSTHAPYRLTNRQLERLTNAGASKGYQIEQAVAALDVQLSAAEAARLEQPYEPRAVLGHS